MKSITTSKNPPLNLYPLIDRGDQSDWMVIHRFHARHCWQRAKGRKAKARLLAQAILWPFRIIPVIQVKTRRFGKSIARATGVSQGRQRLQQLSLAFFQGISPKSYYLFQLYFPDNRKRAQLYLHRYETKGSAALYRTISKGCRSGHRLLNDKHAFHRHCVQNSLPTAPVHMIIGAGPSDPEKSEAELPACDLFIKPSAGRGGKGTQIWRYRGDRLYESTEGQSLEGNALLAQLRRDSADAALLVQTRLENHPDLKGLCGEVFSTARIMTVLNETFEPEVTTAVFRMANGSAVVDNIHRGGLAAAVDLESGTLGGALSLGPDAMRVDRHPTSAIDITGFKLPLWDQAKSLAIRTHKTMPGDPTVVVGWDIGFTKDGPVLVEGNSGPCVHLLQRGLGAPLGGTRFSKLIAFHLARVQTDAGQQPKLAKAA